MKSTGPIVARTVEQRAIEYVMQYEKDRGRQPKIVRRQGFDIWSSGRAIEVKGAGSPNPGFVQLDQYNFRALQKEKDYWLYVVCNVSGEPKLVKLSKMEILERAKFGFHWEIPIWKKDIEQEAS